jgi:ubiquinone/menaquinone biosynthesis C-methylase UbiE
MSNEADLIAEAYNKYGQNYHESRISGRLFNEYLEVPTTFSLIPKELSGNVVLDAGCGSGFYARRLGDMGAKVIAVDISEKMIEIAKAETPESMFIDYRIGNLYHLDLKDELIDLIVCNYVLENLEDLNAVFHEFYRVLKTGGRCIFSISHPFRAHSLREKKEGMEQWMLTNYFEAGSRISDLGGGLKVKKYKRTISQYINSAIQAGFQISQLIEAQPIEEGKEVDLQNYKTAMRLPQLMTVSLAKP